MVVAAVQVSPAKSLASAVPRVCSRSTNGHRADYLDVSSSMARGASATRSASEYSIPKLRSASVRVALLCTTSLLVASMCLARLVISARSLDLTDLCAAIFLRRKGSSAAQKKKFERKVYAGKVARRAFGWFGWKETKGDGAA